MKSDLFSKDSFFRFNLEELATIEAVIVGSGAVAIFLYACHGIITANEESLVTKRVIGHLNTDDFSIFWDEDDLKLNSYAIMDEVEWKIEMPKYELWSQCLDGLIKAYQVASVMTT
ncbi:MAG: hypothetical protein WC708_01225 [Lentisphaeria bacterium]